MVVDAAANEGLNVTIELARASKMDVETRGRRTKTASESESRKEVSGEHFENEHKSPWCFFSEKLFYDVKQPYEVDKGIFRGRTGRSWLPGGDDARTEVV